ncbi:hypothetical protein ACEPPN_016572 [Leptodophora sp. 'Broadleaf-Isolate-01']
MSPTPAAESPHILFELSADTQTINIDGLLVILALWGEAEGLTLSSRDTIIVQRLVREALAFAILTNGDRLNRHGSRPTNFHSNTELDPKQTP